MSEQSPLPASKRPLFAGAQLRGRDVGLCLAIAAILAVGGYILLSTGLRVVSARSETVTENTVWAAVYSLSLIGAVYFVFVRSRRISLLTLTWVTVDHRLALLAMALGILIYGISWAGFQVVDLFIERIYDYSLGVGPDTTLLQVATLVMFIGILGPFAEELMFRGLLFRWIRQRWSFWPAALASSVLFGAVHLYWDAIINAAIAGLAFAWLFERSRSLLASTIMHQTWNTLSVLFEWIEYA